MTEGDPLLWHIILQLVLIITNAVFASAEIALVSINSNKLEKLAEDGDKRAVTLLSLTKQPAKFLATIQVCITLAGFLGSAFAADNFSEKLVALALDLGITLPISVLDTIAVILITLILSFVTLVFGELVPKRVAMKKTEPLAFALCGFVFFVSKLFAPVVLLLTKSTDLLLRMIHIDPDTDDEAVTEEDIRLMVDIGSQKGTIDVGEKELINNIFEFDNKTAVKVMTHRLDVALLWAKDDDETWEKTIVEKTHSYYPICGETPDDIIGVLKAKDYLLLKDHSRKMVMEKAVRPANFVPESIGIDVLFKKMKSSRNHFVVILDEYGGMSGIVTMNDLVEQLVGNLSGDLESQGSYIEQLDTGTWRIDGSVPVERVSKIVGISLPLDKLERNEIDGYDSFGKLIFSLLGYIPEDGETLEFEGLGMHIKIEEIKRHKVEKAIVSLKPLV